MPCNSFSVSYGMNPIKKQSFFKSLNHLLVAMEAASWLQISGYSVKHLSKTNGKKLLINLLTRSTLQYQVKFYLQILIIMFQK